VRVLDNSAATEAQARAVEELRINLNQMQRQNAHLGEDLEHHQKLLAELRQEYLQVKNRYTKETQLWAERQKFLEGKLANLEETLQEQAAAFAEVESLRQQKAELEAALTKNNAKLTSLKHALASAQEVLSGESLTPTAKLEPEANEGSETLSGNQVAAAVETTLKESTNNLDSHTIQLENRLEALPLVPRGVLITLQKVLQSLLSNAIAASPQGSSIYVELLPSDDQTLPESLEIRVTDQGGGLSEVEQSTFLGILTGAENDLPQSIGDAQALQQAVTLVQAAGGHWWIHTEPGCSSTYRVSLPLDEHDALS
jgi:signal transduction histidine kinase